MNLHSDLSHEGVEQNSWTIQLLYHIAIITGLSMNAIDIDSIVNNVKTILLNIESQEMQELWTLKLNCEINRCYEILLKYIWTAALIQLNFICCTQLENNDFTCIWI